MRRMQNVIAALAATALGVSGLAVTAGPAAADHRNGACLVIDETYPSMTYELSGNVGPCDGHGIIVKKDGLELNLKGFSVLGAKQEMEQVGVLLRSVTGVTVRNGSVKGFDAGVAIEGGGGNTVKGMIVRDNVNDMIEAIDPRSIIIPPGERPTPEQMHDISRVSCTYGDGITTFASDGNTITGNTVVGNGPYSGISLVGDSNANRVANNTVAENDLLNDGVVDEDGNPVLVSGGFHTTDGTGTPPQSMCGATEIGTPGMGRGRQVQSIGIRLEGPGADNNIVDKNNVTKGGLAGVSFHSYVLVPAAPNVPVGSSNRNNTVTRNDVSRTGEDTSMADSFADGIASLASGPVGTVTRPSDSNVISRNNSFNNYRHGISLGRLSFNNTIDRNSVTGNGDSGIWLAGPVAPNPTNPSFDFQGAHDNLMTGNRGRRNGNLDGNDQNPDCDNNIWVDNDFRTASECIMPGGGVAAARLAGSAEVSGGGMSHSRN